MVVISLVGLFLLHAVKSMSPYSPVFQPEVSYEVEDSSHTPAVESFEHNGILELLPQHQESKRHKRCKNKPLLDKVLALLKRMQNSDEAENGNSNEDQLDDILDKLNHDNKPFDKYPDHDEDPSDKVLDHNNDPSDNGQIPTYEDPVDKDVYPNKMIQGKVKAKIIFVLELPSPFSSGCKKALSKSIRGFRQSLRNLVRSDVCQQVSYFDSILGTTLKKPNVFDNPKKTSAFHHKVLPTMEVESTTPHNPTKTHHGGLSLGNMYNPEPDHYATRSERVPKLYDTILEKEQETVYNQPGSKSNNDSLLSLEVDKSAFHYPSDQLNDQLSADEDEFDTSKLGITTVDKSPHKNTHENVLSILEDGNLKDNSLYGLQVKHELKNNNTVLSFLQNIFEDNEKVSESQPKSYNDFMSVLHNYKTKHNVKGEANIATTVKTVLNSELELPYLKPVRNAETYISSMLHNNAYDGISSDDDQLNPLPDMDSVYPINNYNFDQKLHLLKKPLTIEVTPGPLPNSPFNLDNLNSNLKIASFAPISKSFHSENEFGSKKNVLALLKQAKLIVDNYKEKHNTLDTSTVINDYLGNDLTSHLGQTDDNNHLHEIDDQNELYHVNSHLFTDKFHDNQLFPFQYKQVNEHKGKYGNGLHKYKNYIIPLQNKINVFDTIPQQIEANTLKPHVVNDLQSNYHSHDSIGNNYNRLQTVLNSQDETNPYEVIATPNQAGEIELTYLLKKPKPVFHTPTYYVKYRIPYQNYILNLKNQQKLKKTPIEFHNDLIGKSRPVDFSPDLRSYQTDEIKKLVATNGNLVTATLEDGDRIKKLINLRDVKDLKSLLDKLKDHELDLPDISFGALTDEKKDSLVKNVISNLLQTYINNDENVGMDESNINENWKQISSITDELSDDESSSDKLESHT